MLFKLLILLGALGLQNKAKNQKNRTLKILNCLKI